MKISMNDYDKYWRLQDSETIPNMDIPKSSNSSLVQIEYQGDSGINSRVDVPRSDSLAKYVELKMREYLKFKP